MFFRGLLAYTKADVCRARTVHLVGEVKPRRVGLLGSVKKNLIVMVAVGGKSARRNVDLPAVNVTVDGPGHLLLASCSQLQFRWYMAVFVYAYVQTSS